MPYHRLNKIERNGVCSIKQEALNKMEVEMEYTKGEWKFTRGEFNCSDESNSLCIGSITGGEEEYFIARIENAEECEANAHLIAASPDMYEACKGVLDWWQRNYDGFLPSEIANVLKAVDKAEGK